MSLSSLVSSPAGPAGPARASATRLHGRWLMLSRVVWLIAAALLIASFLLTRPLVFAQVEQVCSGAACGSLLRQEDLPVLAEWGLSPASVAAYGSVLVGLASLVWIAMGMLLFWRQSAEPRTLFFSFFLVLSGGGPTLDLVVPPIWWLPMTVYAFLFNSCLTLFLCLFPTGQFVPRWTRSLALIVILVDVPNKFFPDLPLSPSTWPAAVQTLFMLGSYGCLIVAQVYRYRWRSTPLERQQTKWVLLALGVSLLLDIAWKPVHAGAAPPFWVRLVYATVSQLAFLLIPVAIATAILRYRLWEVDALINKALVYGSLTGLLGALYAGLIIGLTSLAGLFGGTAAQNPVVLVISTLAIWVLFLPARRRIQRFIDRRFYRRKYDAEKTLAAFSATLHQETDLEQLQAQVLAVVQETMQPAHVSLWLRLPASRPPLTPPATVAPSPVILPTATRATVAIIVAPSETGNPGTRLSEPTGSGGRTP